MSTTTPSNPRRNPVFRQAMLLWLAWAMTVTAVPPESGPVSIPVARIGADATDLADTESLHIRQEDGNAIIACRFQQLEGVVDANGLSVFSTDGGARSASALRIRASAIGRTDASRIELPSTGTVNVADSIVRFVRPGITEEYTPRVDGIRQDFLIHERPQGAGRLCAWLAVEGATVEAVADGQVTLRLDKGGRRLSYHRLHVTDSRGRELESGIQADGTAAIRVNVDDTGATYPVRVDPTFSDANWVCTPGLGGADGNINALAYDYYRGRVYAGGFFTEIGGVAANRVACWDGTSWTALGTGINGTVWSLGVDPSGNLYAGGSFTAAGDKAASRIACWNGTQWNRLGSGMNAEVMALAADAAGNLVAGGFFTTAGGGIANRIARWNGIAWTALGTGMNGAVNGLVIAPGNEIYAGGSFTSADGSPAFYIAKWNGAAWAPLGSGVNASVLSLTRVGTTIYAAGSFTQAGGNPVNNIARWNGTSWSALGTGVSGAVFALDADATGNIFAGGNFTMAGGITVNRTARWNGTAWSAMETGVNGNVNAIVVDKTGRCFAAGAFTQAGGKRAERIARWNGTSWGLGFNHDVMALATDKDGNLYAGGYFTTAPGDIAASYIARWNGRDWSALGTGVNAPVRAIAIDSTGILYAGGQFTTAGGEIARRIARWNGVEWSGVGPTRTHNGVNDTVLALAIDNTSRQLYAGGYFTTITAAGGGNVSAGRVARWTIDGGVSWTGLGTGMTGAVDTVNCLVVATNGHLFAGGEFSKAGTALANRIARWNGTNWYALGSGVGGAIGSVSALALDGNGMLYAGGFFANAGGLAANAIARWNGSSWSALGLGMPSEVVLALAVDTRNHVYAGGSFTSAGGLSANALACWNGTAWRPLGSGVEGESGVGVSALAFDNGRVLHVGGSFGQAGGKPSINLARAYPLRTAANDFDGDGLSDPGTYMPSSGKWRMRRSDGGGTIENSFGYVGTVPITGDFDGDGIMDYGCYDPKGIPGLASPGSWYIMQSRRGFRTATFGYPGTIPIVGDFDGDGITDFGCYDPKGIPGLASPGSWFIMQSRRGFRTASFGYPGTIPIAGDFDGDGVADFGCYDPNGIPALASPGSWYIMPSSHPFRTATFGYPGTVPIAGDFDGDGTTDFGCYDPKGIPGHASPGSWYTMQSRRGFRTATFGYPGTVAIVGDYDGDGEYDYGCYDPNGIPGHADPGTWYIMQTTAGFLKTTFGGTGTIPLGK